MDPAAAGAAVSLRAAALVRARLTEREAAGEAPAMVAVTAATGALGPVLAKLTALLADEFMLSWWSKRDIKLVKSKLEPVHSLLLRIWEREDVEDACKSWMTEVRDRSYAMEDAIDDFIASLKRDDTAGRFRQATKASPFRDLKKQVKKMVKQCQDKGWTNLETISNDRSSKPPVDPRARFLHDASELVGMDSHKEEIIKYLLGSDFSCAAAAADAASLSAATVPAAARQLPRRYRARPNKMEKHGMVRRYRARPNKMEKHGMVCIVAAAGMGKTTLADLVYQAIGEKFQCRAFVSLSPSPDMTQVLKSILTQVTNGVQSSGTEAATEQHLVDKISSFLADKRYLVLVDDIWQCEDWEIIRRALPENSLSSKIIMTTRIKAIANKCKAVDVVIYSPGFNLDDDYTFFEKNEARTLLELIMKKSGVDGKLPETESETVFNNILGMCAGMPLAVICLARALADSLTEGTFEGSDTWIRHIRSDFLSIPSLRPLVESLRLGYNDLPVQLKTCLLYCTMYPGHGPLISRSSLVRKWIAEGFVYQEDAAESYYNELISTVNRSPYDEEGLTVHPMMLAFLVCKSEEVNFVTRMTDWNERSLNRNGKWIQRLSIFDRKESIDFSRMGISHTRSLILYGEQQIVPDIKHFGRLRVLHLRNNQDLENEHLAAICGLLSLRYLGISWCEKISMLPREIGRLQNLETLNVCGTDVRELPWEAAQLPNLLCVLHGDDRVVKWPEVLREAMTTGTDLSYQAMCPSIIVRYYFEFETEQLHFKFGSRYVGVPHWISASFRDVSSLDIMLCKLEEEDQKLLGELPNLKNLVVRLQLLPRKTIPIIGGGFGKLENFCFDCRLPRVTFQPGAMPNLETLVFKFYSGPPSKDPLNIKHLGRLGFVKFRYSEYYSSDAPGISATIDVVRREAAEHPNGITLLITGKPFKDFPAKKNIPETRDQDNNTTQGAARRSASDAKSSNDGDDNTSSNKGKSPRASNHASCSRTSEVHEIEETQE